MKPAVNRTGLRGVLHSMPAKQPAIGRRRNGAIRLEMALVRHRPPVRSHICTDHPTPRADHPRAQRAHRQLVGQVVSVDRHAVIALPRDAVDQQIAAAVGSDVAEGD
jgi:hypothetical protein